MRTLMIYEKTKKITLDQPMISFTVGKRIPKKEMDRMFSEASKQLNVPEKKLVYDIFD